MKKAILATIRRAFGYEKIRNQLNTLATKEELMEMRQAQLFHDSIIDSEWFKYKSISLGEWAIDYGTAYVIYRILNQMQPHHILEFGLGQSSRLIYQYAQYYNTEAITIEHDANWVDFFTKDIGDKYKINIELVDLEIVNYKGYDVLTYKDIQKKLYGQSFDFIFVDSPFGDKENGGGCYEYSRSQIIDIVRNNLMESFCVLIHDTDRIGERNTIEEVESALKQKDVHYAIREYIGRIHCTLICSEDLHFLTTL